MYYGMSADMYQTFFEPVFRDNPSGILHALYANLYKHGLHHNVTIVAGGSQNYPPLDYSVVWTDAAHDMTEIKRNEPVWLELWRHARHGMVFAFHDVSPRKERKSYVRGLFPGRASFEYVQDRTYFLEVHK